MGAPKRSTRNKKKETLRKNFISHNEKGNKATTKLSSEVIHEKAVSLKSTLDDITALSPNSPTKTVTTILKVSLYSLLLFVSNICEYFYVYILI
jgi:hypothetical protein